MWGNFIERSYGEIQTLLNIFTINDQNWRGEGEPNRGKPKVGGGTTIYELRALRVKLSRISKSKDG